jgi:16S rRNA (guanine527-N7)-methyltransferase
MKDFVSWIKYNINKKSFNDLKNGVLYLKGGDLKEELKSFKNVKTFELSDFFNEDFFNEKKVVYLPIKYKTKN